jgi:hypothetical protein
MSNNNKFWGRRYGSFNPHVPKNCSLPWGNVMPTSGKGSTRTNTGKTVTKPDTNEAKAMRKAYQEYRAANNGPYRLYYKSNGQLDKKRTKEENV